MGHVSGTLPSADRSTIVVNANGYPTTRAATARGGNAPQTSSVLVFGTVLLCLIPLCVRSAWLESSADGSQDRILGCVSESSRHTSVDARVNPRRVRMIQTAGSRSQRHDQSALHSTHIPNISKAPGWQTKRPKWGHGQSVIQVTVSLLGSY
jgi:hypothetical protein